MMREWLNTKNVVLSALLIGFVVALGMFWTAGLLTYVFTVGLIAYWFVLLAKDYFLSLSIGVFAIMVFVVMGSGIEGITSLIVYMALSVSILKFYSIKENHVAG